jgi:hypothetical protein
LIFSSFSDITSLQHWSHFCDFFSFILKGLNMSRQIQIRRGSTTEYENFTGVIGEVTMDTDKKTLRVHDGSTVGGIALARVDQIPETSELPETYDFVIETWTQGSGWYRKYKSKWIEQGGYVTGGTANIAVTLPVTMANSTYSINVTGTLTSSTAGSTASVNISTAPSVTNFYVNNFIENGSTRAGGIGFWWIVRGFAA